MKLNKNLSIFLVFHFIIWSLLPILLRPNLPMDSSEALVWGFIGEWGTNKHPPLSGFCADIFYKIFNHPSSLYVLSQIFVVGGLIYIYKTARLFLSENKSLIATLILEGVAYYNMVTPEYNVNIIALFLWPAATFHFYKALNENKTSDWFLLGLYAGLNMLNKYVSGILLMCFGAYILFTREGRQALKSWKIYFAGAIALIIVIPHIYWLHQHDYYVLDYFLGRSSGGKKLPYGLAHIVYPLKFIGSQILTSAFALIVLFCAWFSGKKTAADVSLQNKRFIFYTGVLPLVIMTLISFVLGIKLKSMWGSPVMYMLGICFFAWFPFDDNKLFKPMLKSCWGALILFAFAFIMQVLFTTSAKFKINASEFTSQIAPANTKYVGGSVWLASTIGVYSEQKPEVMFLMQEKENPWINMSKLKSEGILVVDENPIMYQNYQKIFPNLPNPQVYHLTVKSLSGKVKKYNIYYGTITGEQNER